MKAIAQIIADNRKEVEHRIPDFINIYSSMDEIPLGDRTLPTLIIGKAKSESIYGKEMIKVLNKNIKDEIYWTESKMEIRDKFERGLEEFIKRCYKNIIKKLKYQYFDLFLCHYTDIKNVIKYLLYPEEKVFYVENDFIYMLKGGDKVVGFSLEDAEYMGVPKEKIYSLLTGNSHHKFVTNTDFLSEKTCKYITDNSIITPFLYYLHTF